ncbi:hypothetical protein [Streptomyces spongiicola]|uniref:hypothetical protein n=1 Tax=Streptomyces spongiicola TaxID=1690221 RepID=UPI003F4D5FB4
MSENREDSPRRSRPPGSADGPDGRPGAGSGGRAGPRPEEIRFFGTTWVNHDGGYGLRRVAVAAGSLAAAVAGCLVLRFAYQGLETARVGGFVDLLLIVTFSVCSAVAFRKTWKGFSRRPDDPAREESLRSLRMIGFIGALLAYFLRSLTEAPGEELRRAEYETALARYEKRQGARTGNPGARRKPRRR